MDGLDERQTRAVAQLREIIDGADEDVAIGVLDSVDWDVQRAADLIFGGNAGTANANAPSSSSSSRRGEEFDIDDDEDSSQRGEFENAFPPHDDEPMYPPRQRVTLTPLPLPLPPHANANAQPLLPALARPLLTLLTFPLHVLSSVFKFIFSVLRIPFPQLRFMGMNLGLNLNLNPGSYPLRPRPGTRAGPGAGNDRWLRELEEETGAVSIARSRRGKGNGAERGTASGMADPGHGHGASSLTSRIGGSSIDANGDGDGEEGRKYLPDFTISTYEDFLRTCQKETKVGCVILVSEEHDDVPEFKRTTLTDPTFVKTLYDNDILVWGGDVRDREAWSAAQKLQATTYPFIAFLALQPRRTGFPSLSSLSAPSSTSNPSTTPPPSLTVLSRHQGPPLPLSSTPLLPGGPTSPHTLTHHITTQLLPRTTPYLLSLRTHAASLAQERVLRAEQDAAFSLAAKRDKERIEGKMREERERALEGRRREAEERREREVERRRGEEEARRREERMRWRRWTRSVVVGGSDLSGNGSAGGKEKEKEKETLRIAIRLPSGARIIHAFPASASLTALYALVDAHLVPPEYPASEDPLSPPTSPFSPSNSSNSKEHPLSTLESHILSSYSQSQSPSNSNLNSHSNANANQAYWGFLVLSAYPRVEIPWSASSNPTAKLGDVKELRGGGQVVVELLRDAGSGSASARGSLDSNRSGGGGGKGANGAEEDEDEDDGYHTEDSE